MTDDELRHRFEKTLDFAGNTHTVADVRGMIADGRAQFWRFGDGITITTIDEYPQAKVINYWLSAGNLRDCLALEHEINPWAIEQGCSIATVTGRKGWRPFGEKTGWRLRAHMFSKDLVDRGL